MAKVADNPVGPAGPSVKETFVTEFPGKATATAAAIVYVVAFVVGAIVMSFEMLGSRYLNPYFGSGIYTWASLISTVLLSLTVGYFIGGWLADRNPRPASSASPS